MFGLDFIRSLKPCKWRYTGSLDDGVEHFGFIAQEVNKIANFQQYGFVVMMDNGYYGLNMTEFIGPIVKAIQELDDKIEQMRKEIDARTTVGDQLGND